MNNSKYDPEGYCLPPGGPRLFATPYPMEIIQQPELKRIIINGFKSSFLPYAQKARMLRDVNLEIDRVFMEEYPDEYDRRASY